LLREVASTYQTARVPVTVEAPEQLNVCADREELRRAIANLTDNAVRHATASVRLRMHADVDNIVLQVDDDGPGIAPADRERVFDRFTRLDDARDRDAGGFGLGLAIVRELVSRAGGTVWLTSRDVPALTDYSSRAPETAGNSEPGTSGLRAEIRLPVAPLPDAALPRSS
jgi:signal transduction histidine kinase